jgi:hypothetical protein
VLVQGSLGANSNVFLLLFDDCLELLHPQGLLLLGFGGFLGDLSFELVVGSGTVIFGDSAAGFEGINNVSVTSDDLGPAIRGLTLLLELQMINEVLQLLSTKIVANLKINKLKNDQTKIVFEK